MSIFDAGGTGLGLLGVALAFSGEGGVVPEESLELIDEIHEFLRPTIGFGALLWIADCDPADFGSVPLTSLFVAGPDSGPPLFAVSFDSGEGLSEFDRGGLPREGRWATVLSELDWSLKFGLQRVLSGQVSAD